MEKDNFAELIGVVKYVKPRKNKRDPSEFTVHTVKSNKNYNCVCEFFCPLQDGDTIYALCKFKENNTLQVVRPPFVQIACDKDSIVRCFIKILRGTGFGNNKAYALFDHLAKEADGDKNVSSYITHLSSLWMKTHDKHISAFFGCFLTKKQCDTLLRWWNKNRDLRRLYLIGLNNKEINSCHLTLHEIYDQCIENPFKLPPISIDKCYEILTRMNKTPQQEDVECGLVVRQLWKNMEERSWSGTPSKIINRDFSFVENRITRLKEKYDVVGELYTVYLKYPAMVEKEVSLFIVNLVKEDELLKEFLEKGEYPALDTERRESINLQAPLNEEQIKAVQGALDHKISIITGGAGTGKTTCIASIIHNLKLRGLPYAICSFTGKAVARLKQVTGENKAATIHRLIATYTKPPLEDNLTNNIPTSFKYIVIDEVSMVTTELFYELIKAYQEDFAKGVQIVLVGDINQLPPIGWGSLFSECIKSNTIPIFTLTINHRVYQIGDEKDGILGNANALIKHDDMYPFDFMETNNFSMLEGNIELVYDLIKQMYENGIPASDVVIISPYNKYLAELNTAFQQIYNDGQKHVIDRKGTVWMVNDRVMATVNLYDINVMNGETGIIRDVNPLSILVQFGNSSHEFLLDIVTDENTVNKPNAIPETVKKYRRENPYEIVVDDENIILADQRTVSLITHAFALTIHKSQGSEYENVIFYIPHNCNSGLFINKNLVYTALTRAKKSVWCVGDIESLRSGCVKKQKYRCENLSVRLKNVLPPVPNNQIKNYNENKDHEDIAWEDGDIY